MILGLVKFGVTAFEAVSTVSCAALGTKVFLDAKKADNSVAYHKNKIDEIAEKKAKAEEAKAEAKAAKQERDSQEAAIFVIKNHKMFGDLGNAFKIFTKES